MAETKEVKKRAPRKAKTATEVRAEAPSVVTETPEIKEEIAEEVAETPEIKEEIVAPQEAEIVETKEEIAEIAEIAEEVKEEIATPNKTAVIEPDEPDEEIAPENMPLVKPGFRVEIRKANPNLADERSKWIVEVVDKDKRHPIFKGGFGKAEVWAKNFCTLHNMSESEITITRK